jgi:hypothetical protein
VGLLTPTAGTIEVLGAPPAAGPAQLGPVGFVPQEAGETAIFVGAALVLAGLCFWWVRRLS